MSNPKKVLITGASGVLGANLVRHFAKQSNCIGLYATNPLSIDGANLEQLDLTNHTEFSKCSIGYNPT
jgi:nucleoside-diphosphate-sugar epimerase